MKFFYCLVIILTSINPTVSQALSTPKDSAEVIEEIVLSTWEEIDASPEIYPHFFVYGLELESSVGVSDIAEFGGSLGIELHFERRTK